MNPKTGAAASLVSDEAMAFVDAHATALDAAINEAQDRRYDYMGFKTLELYLLRMEGKVAERPQHARGGGDPLCGRRRRRPGTRCSRGDATTTYRLMRCEPFTHTTPTLLNAGTPHPKCRPASSCPCRTTRSTASTTR